MSRILSVWNHQNLLVRSKGCTASFFALYWYGCKHLFIKELKKCETVLPSVRFLMLNVHSFVSVTNRRVLESKVSENDVSKSIVSNANLPHGKNLQSDEESLINFQQFDQSLRADLEGNNPTVLPSNSNDFACYVNSSRLLQALLTLGVNLSSVQKNYPESLRFLVTLNFHKDVKPKLQFLNDNGINIEEFGYVLTKYIFILDPSFRVEELQQRIDYLLSKKFTKKEVASMLSKYPQFLSIPYLRLDGILGFYQTIPTHFNTRPIHFGGNSLRSIIVRCPQLITTSLQDVFLTIKALERSCEFTVAQIRNMIYHRPLIMLTEMKSIEDLYKYYANEMNISNELMAKNYFIFDTRLKLEKYGAICTCSHDLDSNRTLVSGHVVASLDEMFYDDYLVLVALNKQQMQWTRFQQNPQKHWIAGSSQADAVSSKHEVVIAMKRVVKCRHLFLKHLGKDKYKEDEPGYVSLYSLVCSDDKNFCEAHQVPFSHYLNFLKTL